MLEPLPTSMQHPELHVLYGLTNKPQLAQSEVVDPGWFDEPYRTYVDYINSHPELTDYVTLRDKFEADYPNKMQRPNWDAVLEADVTTGAFGSWVGTLRRRYFRTKAIEAAQALLKEPTDEHLQEAFEAAQSALGAQTEAEEVTMKDLAQGMQEQLSDPTQADTGGIKTFSALDKIFGDGLMPGRLITIGARPAVGKSAFAVNLVLEGFKHQPEMTTDLFSLEMSDKQVYHRMLASATGIEARKFLKAPVGMSDAELKTVQQSNRKLAHTDLRIWDKVTTLQGLTKTIRQRAASSQHGYLAVVDYLGLISVPRQPDRRLQIEEITRQLKILTQELDIPIVLLSQLSRGIEHRNDKRPMLADLRESGSIEQDSNAVAFLFNDDDKQANQDLRNVTLAVAKNREGALGDIPFNFHADKMRFQVAYV